MQTYTNSVTESFTITHARYLSSKIAADMQLVSDYYGKPPESGIADYAEELAQLVRRGYVDAYEFGFQRSGKRVVTLRYTANESGTLTTDDVAGKVYPHADIVGADFFNHLTYSQKWAALSDDQRRAVEADLPVKRVTGSGPSDGFGSWTTDRTYSTTGVSMSRGTFRPYGS